MAAANCPFLVIDKNQERLREAEAAGTFVIVGDASEDKTLLNAKVERAKSLATVLPDDAMNVFITLTARDLAPDLEIIAWGETPATEKKLLRSGANRVVLPAAIGATRIARLITRPSAEEILSTALGESQLQDDLNQIGLTLNEFRIAKESQLAGRAVFEIDFGGNGRCVVVALRKADGEVTRHPPSETIVDAGDTLIVLGVESEMPRLISRATAARPQMTYRGAVEH